MELVDFCMSSPAAAIETYIRAKDSNRPYLMRQAFAADAALEMVLKTDAISFPSAARGVNEIADVLVRRFGIDYENVYTFCLSRPSDTDRRHFSCQWLVGMSAKADGMVRVGCGRYDWSFGSDARCLVDKFVITIDVMKTFPAAELTATMDWLANLSYPWCSPGEVIRNMPRADGFKAIETYLKQAQPARI